MSNVIEWVKRIYMYIFATVGLVLVIVGSVSFVNLALKTYVFKKADMYYEYPRMISEKEGVENVDEEKLKEYQENETASRRQSQAANALASIIIGIPLFLYHWRIIRKKDF